MSRTVVVTRRGRSAVFTHTRITEARMVVWTTVIVAGTIVTEAYRISLLMEQLNQPDDRYRKNHNKQHCFFSIAFHI